MGGAGQPVLRRLGDQLELPVVINDSNASRGEGHLRSFMFRNSIQHEWPRMTAKRAALQHPLKPNTLCLSLLLPASAVLDVSPSFSASLACSRILTK
ncbi:MAG: hypothetical protein ACI9DF_004990 [Verrucomicrobiales bacterium]|jgi:hypothetical protein